MRSVVIDKPQEETRYEMSLPRMRNHITSIGRFFDDVNGQGINVPVEKKHIYSVITINSYNRGEG